MAESMRELRLPEDLCRAAEEKFGREFGTLEELITFVLRELASDKAAQMDQAEARIIEERLRALGYI
jgi:hypothetical protein